MQPHGERRKSRSQLTVPCPPSEVLEPLTEPGAIARWATVPFDILELEGRRPHSDSRARVAGHLAGRRVESEVVVLDASEQQLALVASPISLGVQYLLRPADGGGEVDASVSVEGHGLFGRLFARATEMVLAAGALRSSLERLGRELEPALNTGGLADATTRSSEHARHRLFCPHKSK